MGTKKRNTQLHEEPRYWLDGSLFGPTYTLVRCSCGWESRPCSSRGVATGLWRRHALLAGRGYSKHDDGTAGRR